MRQVHSPLCYSPLVGLLGFEPRPYGLKARCASRYAIDPLFGASCGNRTRILWLEDKDINPFYYGRSIWYSWQDLKLRQQAYSARNLPE